MRDPAMRPEEQQFRAIARGATAEFCTIGLFVIAVGAILYFGKSLFMPLLAAFVVGTMLSPAASRLQRHGIPRPIGATLIVGATFALIAVVIGLITSPLPGVMERLPDIGAQVKDKLHAFDGVMGLLSRIETITGLSIATDFQLPRIQWVQPTLEFITPTITELLLFFVTLLLFVVGWPELRRRLILAEERREARLRAMKILNEIETRLGGYLFLVSCINLCIGLGVGLIALGTGSPNPIGLAAMAATLNFIPILGPVAMFGVLAVVGLVSFPTISGGLVAPAMFAVLTFLEGHFITPAIIGRRLELNAFAVFVALAFWTWMWGPMGAFLASPILIILLILKEHLFPDEEPQLPEDG